MTNFILSSTFELTGFITSDFETFLCLSVMPFSMPHGKNNSNRALFEEALESLQEELSSLGVESEYYGFSFEQEVTALVRLGQFLLFNPETGEEFTHVYVKNRFDSSGQSHYNALMLCIEVLSQHSPAAAVKLSALKPRMAHVLLEMEKFDDDDNDDI